VRSFRSLGRFSCGGYTSEGTTTGSIATNVTVSAQISGSQLPTEVFGPTDGNLSTFDQTLHAQGTADPTCNPIGGKGAGFGPLSQGNFRFSNQSAFVSLPNGMNLSLFSFSDTSVPRGSAPTTQAQTDLTFSEFAFPFGFTQACFVLPSTAFTISATAASVVATIDSTSTPCPNGPGNNLALPDTVHVNVTWAASGALANFRNNSTFMCNGTLDTVTSSVEAFVNASTSGSVPELVGSVDGLQGGIGSKDSAFHILTATPC
jgi:hypothetical protein